MRKTRVKQTVLLMLRDVVIIFAAFLVISLFVRPIVVNQISMSDTFEEGDYVILSKVAYVGESSPHTFDIVVFSSDRIDADGKRMNLIKRVIAVGGDSISISDGAVYLNGQPLTEPYVPGLQTDGHMDEILIPEGKFFVMGDNRAASQDSRSATIGLVDEGDIMGKVVFQVFPLSKFWRVHS